MAKVHIVRSPYFLSDLRDAEVGDFLIDVSNKFNDGHGVIDFINPNPMAIHPYKVHFPHKRIFKFYNIDGYQLNREVKEEERVKKLFKVIVEKTVTEQFEVPVSAGSTLEAEEFIHKQFQRCKKYYGVVTNKHIKNQILGCDPVEGLSDFKLTEASDLVNNADPNVTVKDCLSNPELNEANALSFLLCELRGLPGGDRILKEYKKLKTK